MRSEITPEEVSKIEHRAYNLGVGVGEVQERKRIIALLTEQYGEDYVDLGVVGQIVALIKGDE